MQSLPIDIEQAQIQLEILGYKPGDPVFLRSFAPKGETGTPKNYQVSIDKLPTYQDPHSGLYLVVNGGGHRDSDVTAPKAIFFEFDDRPIEDQLLAWQEFKLPEPSLQVQTRKSIHTYYALSDSCTVEQWRQLQEDLIAHIGSDPTLKNPSRVMRLAGAWHVKKDASPVRCDAIHYTTTRYTFAELRSIIPSQPVPKAMMQHYPQINLSDSLRDRILPRIGPQQAFYWSGHNWSGSEGKGKMRGCCPWHESQSGTAFYTDYKDGIWVWRCPSCEIGGTALEYRHRMQGGNGHPKGQEFVKLVKELADEAGVVLEDDFTYSADDRPKTLKEIHDTSSVSSAQKAADKYESFRQQIAIALQLSDPIQREFALDEIAISYRKPRNFMQKIVDELEQRRKPQKSKTKFDLHELLNRPSQAVSYLIEDWIPSGESILLSAKPKVGKSLLAYEAAFAVSTGGEFLGRRAKAGKVLIIQTEEGDNEIRKRLYTRGFDSVPEGAIKIWTDWRYHRHGDRADLEAELAEGRYSLVIIDSLRKIQSGSGTDENKSEFATPVYELTDICRSYGASLIVIHHDNKDKEAQGTDAIAGTGALAGAVWGTWRLLRTSTNENNTQRHLSCVIRGGASSRHMIELAEGEACGWAWQWHNELYADPDVYDKEKRIISTLNRNHRPMTMKEICECLGMSAADRSLQRPMNRLIERGRVVIMRDEKNRKLWRYALPHTLPPDPPTDPFNPDQERVSIGTGIGTPSEQVDRVAPGTVRHPIDTNPDLLNRYGSKGGEGQASLEVQDIGTDESEQVGVPMESLAASRLNGSVGGSGGSLDRTPWSEYNGVVHWHQLAKPRLRERPTSLCPPLPVQEQLRMHREAILEVDSLVEVSLDDSITDELWSVIGDSLIRSGEFGYVEAIEDVELSGRMVRFYRVITGDFRRALLPAIALTVHEQEWEEF